MKTRTLDFHCSCGASWSIAVGRVSGRELRDVARAWRRLHLGDGHGPCDATAARTRRAQRATFEDRQRSRIAGKLHGDDHTYKRGNGSMRRADEAIATTRRLLLDAVRRASSRSSVLTLMRSRVASRSSIKTANAAP